ncbi:AraC family transcriptional regulator [uncultured Abyssibacter sp.]|uniref:helix-turn-helix domain-containing protein n=1 Tax=uncultured Abyssibacter sp. TaxID=2320202 RepID=UPI0032B248CE
MTETIFAFDKHNYVECQSAYQGPNNQDYYLGDYSIEGGAFVDVRADKQNIGSCSIALLRSRSRLFFRRALSHIRQDGVDVTVLWFVRRGRLHISHQRGHSIAGPGDFAITKSSTPFTIECLTDDTGRHEVFHVILPTHVFRRFIIDDLRTGFCVGAHGDEFAAAQHILRDLYEREFSASVSEHMMESALMLMAEVLRGHDAGAVRLRLSDQRLADVLKYIDVHLSDPKLSVATVAEGCGISERYLSLLLQRNGTPFASLVWDKRLKIASNWLTSRDSQQLSISEIAYGVGFKSPAHFSRMFKRVFKLSPREYRAANPHPVAGKPTSRVASSVCTLQ